MAWLKGTWEIIKNVPTLIAIARQVYDAYLEFKRKQKQLEMEKAVEKATNGDQRDLERMLRGK